MIIAQAYLLVGADRWPDPGDPLGVEYRLRRFYASAEDQLIAADYIRFYRELMQGSQAQRNALVREIRGEQMAWTRRMTEERFRP